uniref:Uncharacterized protein n=1 Tax=Timema poppense TaxID=170557 RepID=A0A7R9H4D4_TIMPO|nr:unnamed protein product [Timema poppensis]
MVFNSPSMQSQFCKRFRVLERCCEFECLDEPTSPANGGFLISDAPFSPAHSPRPASIVVLTCMAMALLVRVQ